MLPTGAKDRKEYPITSGVLDYFPEAIAAVANVSFIGNKQHNPGEPLHWAREKSMDHEDCIARHLLERGTIDVDGMRHTAKLAWRALALLQLEIEADTKIARTASEQTALDAAFNDNIIPLEVQRKSIYIAGPMRGYERFNFAAFDEARNYFNSRGWNAISPADIDRDSENFGPLLPLEHSTESNAQWETFEAAVEKWSEQNLISVINRDCQAIILCDAIAFLPGWEKSTGAVAEFFIARWRGLPILDTTTGEPLKYRSAFGTEILRSIGRTLQAKGNIICPE